MVFEKPIGNPNCEATERGCDFCVRIGKVGMSNAIATISPDVSERNRNVFVENSKVEALIDGSGEVQALGHCYARQELADKIGYETGVSIAKTVGR